MRKLVLPIVVLAVLCWWFGLEPLVRTLAHASPRGLLLYALLTALVSVGYALRWRLVARAVGADAPLGRLVSARLAGDAVGALVPSAKLAGDPVRVAIGHGTESSTARSAAGVAIDRLLEVIGNLLAVIAYVAVFAVSRGAAPAGKTPAVLAGVMVLLLIGLTALVVRLRRGGRPLAPLYGARARAVAPRLGAWMDGLRTMEDHLVQFFREHRRAFLIGLLGSLAIEALIVVQYHALLAAFGVALEVPTLLLVLLGSGLAHAAPAPAGLGALEAAQVAIVGAAVGRPDLGFVVGVIVRLHETLLLAIGLLVLSYEGMSVARIRAARPRAEA
jgi:uncharacterized protein (TIRG00374 family)